MLATEAVRKILKEINTNIDEVGFYTGTKVVLGYIQNESRRFYMYFANRVQIICTVSEPHHWRYIDTDTDTNPADLVTTGTDTKKLISTKWLTGPEFLRQRDASLPPTSEEIALDQDDPELHRDVTVNDTSVITGMGSETFAGFSSWSFHRRAVAVLLVTARRLKGTHGYDQGQ